MTYAQWLEQCRKQAAERQAEPGEANCLEDGAETDEVAAETDLSYSITTLAPQPPTPVSRASSPPAEKARRNGAPGFAGTSGEGEAASSAKDDPTWLPGVEYFESGRPFAIGDIEISPFTIPHDAADPVGFVFRAEGVRMGFATDLGYITPNVKRQLKGVDILLLESNHDLEMLRDGPYPWSVKQRVLSRVGHLSNEAAAQFLENEYDGQAAYVILAHLSESNNLPELARVTAERALNGRASLLANRLLLATQGTPLTSIIL
jgi:hypothetical protein